MLSLPQSRRWQAKSDPSSSPSLMSVQFSKLCARNISLFDFATWVILQRLKRFKICGFRDSLNATVSQNCINLTKKDFTFLKQI